MINLLIYRSMCVCVCVDVYVHINLVCIDISWASQVVLLVKNMQEVRDTVSVPGQEDPLEEGNPLQYSCLENPMDREAWKAIVHRVTKSQTRLKRLSTRMDNIL